MSGSGYCGLNEYGECLSIIDTSPDEIFSVGRLSRIGDNNSFTSNTANSGNGLSPEDGDNKSSTSNTSNSGNVLSPKEYDKCPMTPLQLRGLLSGTECISKKHGVKPPEANIKAAKIPVSYCKQNSVVVGIQFLVYLFCLCAVGRNQVPEVIRGIITAEKEKQSLLAKEAEQWYFSTNTDKYEWPSTYPTWNMLLSKSLTANVELIKKLQNCISDVHPFSLHEILYQETTTKTIMKRIAAYKELDDDKNRYWTFVQDRQGLADTILENINGKSRHPNALQVSQQDVEASIKHPQSAMIMHDEQPTTSDPLDESFSVSFLLSQNTPNAKRPRLS